MMVLENGPARQQSLPVWIISVAPSAWLLFTKGLRGEAAQRRARIEGDAALAEKFFEILAVMA